MCKGQIYDTNCHSPHGNWWIMKLEVHGIWIQIELIQVAYTMLLVIRLCRSSLFSSVSAWFSDRRLSNHGEVATKNFRLHSTSSACPERIESLSKDFHVNCWDLISLDWLGPHAQAWTSQRGQEDETASVVRPGSHSPLWSLGLFLPDDSDWGWKRWLV